MAHIPTEACSPLSWLEFASGDQLKTELEARLNLWWPRLFGYHLLKLGPLSAEINSLQCQINYHFSLFETEGGAIQASTKDLPLQNSSIDTVLMNSLLEFEQDPYRVLREVDRVVVSGGHIILSGFNPVSPIFFGKLLPQFQNVAPWCGHFFMPSRVMLNVYGSGSTKTGFNPTLIIAKTLAIYVFEGTKTSECFGKLKT